MTDPSDMSYCLFCAIGAGDIPADIVRESERILIFRDTRPQAPTHILAITRQHFANLGDLAGADPTLAGELLGELALAVAGVGLDSGYRVVFNTGTDGGQTVGHVHAHVLGGRSMTWPPG